MTSPDDFTGHTPGPWKVFDEENASTWPGIDASDAAIVIFGWRNDESDDNGVRGTTPKEAQANARLIAAAPRLLAERDAARDQAAELRVLVEQFLQCPEIADCAPEDKEPETSATERAARALLAKIGETG